MSSADGAAPPSLAASLVGVDDSGVRGEDTLAAMVIRTPAGLATSPWARGKFSAAPIMAVLARPSIGAPMEKALGEARTSFPILRTEPPIIIFVTVAIFSSDKTYKTYKNHGICAFSRRDCRWPAGRARAGPRCPARSFARYGSAGRRTHPAWYSRPRGTRTPARQPANRRPTG